MGEQNTDRTTSGRKKPPGSGAAKEGVDGAKAAAVIKAIQAEGVSRLEKEPPIPIGFCEALGMRVLAIGDGEALMATPWRPEFVGDPESGVIHGGVITTLLDTAAGFAAALAVGDIKGLVTLDLRIDYMRPAEPERVVFAKARSFRRARQITFIRATAFTDDEDNPVAVAVGAFMNGGAASAAAEAAIKANKEHSTAAAPGDKAGKKRPKKETKKEKTS